MADQPQVRETTESRPEESAPTRVTAAQRPEKQTPAVEERPQVSFELSPDFDLPDGADSVSVEVGSYEPVKFTRGDTVKVDAEHAFVLQGVPAVRRVQ